MKTTHHFPLSLFLAFSFLIANNAGATPGDLDASFGTGGRVTTDFASEADKAQGLAIQPDGKIVVAGFADVLSGGTPNDDFAVARYNANGTLDSSFGAGGLVTTDFGSTGVGTGGGIDQGYAVVVQADGKIIVAGWGYDIDGGASLTHDFLLIRYNSDGSLDTSFDTDGKVAIDFTGTDDHAYSVVLQGDGKIVVAGDSLHGSNIEFAVARLNPNGSLDTSFNGTGKVTTAIGLGDETGRSVILQSDGKIVLAGYSSNGSNRDFAVVRYNPNGSLDSGFNSTGQTAVPIGSGDDLCYSAKMQSDGKIVLAGSTATGSAIDFGLVRINANGTLDSGFGSAGKVVTPIGTGSDFARSMVVMSDGRILVGGYSSPNASSLARYSSNGSLDLTFNSTGKVSTNVGTSNSGGYVAIQPDGKIVIVGSPFMSGTNLNDFAVFRYLGDQSPSASAFAPTGITMTATTLNGTVNPNGLTSTAQFQYGLTTSYGTNASITLSPSNGSTAQNVSANLTGLTPGTLYHYRLSATNSAGSSDTSDATFTTISTNANLSNLTLSNGTLTPSFAAATTTYTASVPFSTTSLTVTPTKADANATITVNGSAVPSGSASGAISLIVGGNVISTVVTAQDGTTTKTYTTTVTRAAPGPGDLDVAFNATGKVTTAFGGLNDNGYGVAVQSDGKVVVAGYTDANGTNDFALARYNADGSLDSSFGSGGKVVTLIGTDSDQARAVALQGDGKIVAAGYSLNAGNNDFAVVRYNTNGTLDTSFNGTGKVVTTFGTGNDTAQSVVVQSDGKIVAGGYFFNGSNFDFALARYNSNGTLDTSFNGTGKATVAFGAAGDTDQGAGLALQGDGKILFTGYTYNGSVSVVALARYNTNGTLDTTFDGDGRVTTAIGTTSDSGSGVAVQSDGKIVVGCYTQNASPNYDFAVLRYTTTGALDAAFGTGGKVSTPVGSGDDSGYALALQSDGKILVVGPSVIGGNNDFGVVRYTTSGALDTTFNGTGKVTTAIGTGNDTAQSVVAAPDGSILVAGYTRTGSDYDFALVRYLGDPQLPILQTLAATSVTPSTATLNGTVNPNGLATTAQFEYGLTTSYGSTASVTLSPNNGSVAQNVNAALTGLTPGSTYHYRITATNSAGTANGGDLTFNTPPAIPEIRVFAGVDDTAPELTDGQAAVLDFGSTQLGTPVARSFTVKNVGFADLHVSSLTLPPGYLYVGTAFPWTLVPNSTLTFQVRFLANSVHGTFAGAMTLANDDADEGPFDLAVSGTATFSGPVVQQWAQRYNGPGNNTDYAQVVAMDGSGNVVVTGVSYNGTNYDYYTAKYAFADGALLWEKRYNGPANGEDFATAMAVDGSGNVVVTGASNNASGIPDFYTAKYAAIDGALLWEKRFNGPANGDDSATALAVDGGGNVFVTGRSSNGSNGTNFDYYTAKYAAASGALIWETRYNGSANSDDWSLALVVDGSGNLLVTGYSYNASGNVDYYTAKYAGADGALVWEKRYNGPASGNDVAYKVAVDGNGNVVVTGNSYNASGNTDYYTAKYAAPDGALVWEKRNNGPANGNDAAHSVAVDNAGNVVVTGSSVNATGNNDSYTAKYAAADGALLWEKRDNGPGNIRAQSSTVVVDSLGNVVVTGSSDNTTGDSDYYTAKYASASGELLWEASYNGPASSNDHAASMAIDGSGNVVVTGYSYGAGGISSDYATVRYGPTATAPTVVTSAATSVTATTATLNGTVNANGILTSAWFECGLTTSYGTSTTSQAQGYGTSASAVTAALTGLTPNTLYHYRLVAQNGETTAYGSDLTFTTLTLQQGWRQQYFGTSSNTGNAADSFDFDNDGLPNLLEWACNLNPTTASVLPVTTIRNGVFFEFTYTRSVAALNAGATFTVEWSDTLPGPNPWSSIGVTQTILSDNGTVQQVKATVPAGMSDKRFVHLKVMSPP